MLADLVERVAGPFKARGSCFRLFPIFRELIGGLESACGIPYCTDDGSHPRGAHLAGDDMKKTAPCDAIKRH